MNRDFGNVRVLAPRDVLPASAWEIDNNRNIYRNELRLSIERIHIDPTSFKQILLETAGNDAAIRQKIMDIVIKRGKLHNPVTGTGGLLCGRIEEIGPDYANTKGFRKGDRVLLNVSLSGVPLFISNIRSIDKAFGQIDAEGYAIVFDGVPLVAMPEELPLDLMLFVFNESGSLFKVASLDYRGKSVLIVGNNILTNILFGYAVRRAAGSDVHISCVFDKRTDVVVRGKSVDQLLSETFDEINYLDVLRPIECVNSFDAYSKFDVSINCSNIPGAETINVLATKSGGHVFFTNILFTYNTVVYLTEFASKQLEINSAVGYLEEYDAYDIELVRELAPYLAEAIPTEEKTGKEKSSRERSPFTAQGHEKAVIDDMIYESPSMARVVSEIIDVSNYDCNVLIMGPTGVGKEKVAAMIQKNSSRNMQSFIKINCASISPSLIESEFFGYEKGAFTGASAGGKKGYFELADAGTIFLDEIGELPLEMQGKLLRVVQDGEFYRVGGTRPVKTDVRIISATNRDLEEEIEKGGFRRDLYYRLNVFPIKVPPLRERREDIPSLVSFFLDRYCKKFLTFREMDEDALEYLMRQDWPGNVRELENTIQRLIIGAKGGTITLQDVTRQLEPELYGEGGDSFPEQLGRDGDSEQGNIDLSAMVDSYEKQLIKQALEKYGSTRKAAKAIGISQTQLVRKKNKYGL